MSAPRPVALIGAATFLLLSSCGGGSSVTTVGPEGSVAATASTTQQVTTTSTQAPPTTPVPSAATEDVTFTSGRYSLGGDLVLPGESARYPAVIVVSGDGSQTRLSTPDYSEPA